MKQLSQWVFTVWGLIALSSCDDQMSQTQIDETVKDVTGRWQVVQLTRNGEDLSKRLDLTDYYIQFNADGTYTLSEELPFVVHSSGSYSLSDPRYPFAVLLQPEGSLEDATVKFQFPVVKGERQMVLTLSLGCSSSSYQFSFERQK